MAQEPSPDDVTALEPHTTDTLPDIANELAKIATDVPEHAQRLREISHVLLSYSSDESDDDDDEELDEDEDEELDAYAEEHIQGREWIPVSFMDGSRTFALPVFGHESTIGVVLRTVTWGGEDTEFSSAMVYLPGVSLREVERTDCTKTEKKRRG